MVVIPSGLKLSVKNGQGGVGVGVFYLTEKIVICQLSLQRNENSQKIGPQFLLNSYISKYKAIFITKGR